VPVLTPGGDRLAPADVTIRRSESFPSISIEEWERRSKEYDETLRNKFGLLPEEQDNIRL